MRLLHTSDWHLGRYLRTVPMVAEQSVFLAWLAEFVREQRIDAVLVAGDIYDRAIPSVDAVPMLQGALVDLVRTCPVVLISGNHDSATRLGFGGPLLETAGVHLRSSVDDIDRPVEIVGSDGVRVLVYGIPYLEPEVVRARLDAEKSHEAVLTAAMDRIRSDIDARTDGERPCTVVLAHAFVTGGQPSDSERDVSVGGVADAPASVFHGVDYVALGHLHGPQDITSDDAIVRYSGSPLPYSFSEESHLKSVTIVDIAPDGAISLDTVATPVPRPMRTLTGDLADLLDDPALEDAQEAWVRAIVTDAQRPENAMDRLRTRFPFTIELTLSPHLDGTPIVLGDEHADPRSSDPLEVVSSFIAHVRATPASDDERRLVQESIERIRIAEAGA